MKQETDLHVKNMISFKTVTRRHARLLRMKDIATADSEAEILL